MSDLMWIILGFSAWAVAHSLVLHKWMQTMMKWQRTQDKMILKILKERSLELDEKLQTLQAELERQKNET